MSVGLATFVLPRRSTRGTPVPGGDLPLVAEQEVQGVGTCELGLLALVVGREFRHPRYPLRSAARSQRPGPGPWRRPRSDRLRSASARRGTGEATGDLPTQERRFSRCRQWREPMDGIGSPMGIRRLMVARSPADCIEAVRSADPPNPAARSRRRLLTSRRNETEGRPPGRAIAVDRGAFQAMACSRRRSASSSPGCCGGHSEL